MNGALRLAILAACMALGTAAGAQTVYRCGADGKTYSQQPCSEGRAIDVSDPRTREQAAQTGAAVKRDAREAAALDKERRHGEARDARQGAKAASLSAAAPPPLAASRPAPHKHEDKRKAKPRKGAEPSEDFRAVEPVKAKPAGSR